MSSRSYTVGQYLTDRLHELDIRHLFSVPGAHCAEWLHDYVESGSAIRRLGVTNPANAGYAADGYARMNGLGAVCVPYSVGTLALLNPMAGAFVERAPVVVITGAPPSKPNAEEHHRPFVSDRDANRRVFENVTCAAEHIENPERAPVAIDRCLQSCLQHRQPVYLELASDIYDRSCSLPKGPLPVQFSEAPETVQNDIASQLRYADSVVVWAGVELQRYGLEEEFKTLIQTLDAPYVTTLLAKGLLPEDDDRFAGIFAGSSCPPAVQDLVEDADFVLGLGVTHPHTSTPDALTNANAATLVRRGGIDDTPPDRGCLPDSVTVHSVDGLRSLLFELRTDVAERVPSFDGTVSATRTRRVVERTETLESTAPDDPITYPGFYKFIEAYVGDDTILMSGTGLDRFGTQTLPANVSSGFVCQSAYSDAGYVTPAAMGVDLGSGDERVLVFVGDGGFQMTVQCVGTMAEKGLDPIIFVLNNGVYGAEQRRTNPAPFEGDAPFSPQTILQQWHYRKLPDAFGGKGWRIETYDHLQAAVEEAFKYTGGPLLLDVRVQQKSLPPLAAETIESPEQPLDLPTEAVIPSSP